MLYLVYLSFYMTKPRVFGVSAQLALLVLQFRHAAFQDLLRRVYAQPHLVFFSVDVLHSDMSYVWRFLSAASYSWQFRLAVFEILYVWNFRHAIYQTLKLLFVISSQLPKINFGSFDMLHTDVSCFWRLSSIITFIFTVSTFCIPKLLMFGVSSQLPLTFAIAIRYTNASHIWQCRQVTYKIFPLFRFQYASFKNVLLLVFPFNQIFSFCSFDMPYLVAAFHGRFEGATEETSSPEVQLASNNRDSQFGQVHSIAACAQLPVWSTPRQRALGMWRNAPSRKQHKFLYLTFQLTKSYFTLDMLNSETWNIWHFIWTAICTFSVSIRLETEKVSKHIENLLHLGYQP